MHDQNSTGWAIVLMAGLAVLTPSWAVAQTCVEDTFSYPDGPLAGPWTGASSTLHQVSSGALRLPFAIGTASDGPDAIAVLPVDCGPCEDGTITVKFKIKATEDAVGGFAWGLQVRANDPDQREVARWYGWPNSARPRISQSVLTNEMISTTSYDELKAVINVKTNRTEFFKNGVSAGTLSHGANNGVAGWEDSGNRLSVIEVTHWNRDDPPPDPPFAGELFIDDLQVIGCEGTCALELAPAFPELAAAPGGLAAFTEEGVDPPMPAAFDFTLTNTGEGERNYTLEKMNLLGANADWLTLVNPNDGVLSPDEAHEFQATLSAAGLAGGEHVVLVKATDDCEPARSYTRAVKLFVADDTNCFVESFPYANDVLVGQPGWSGTAGEELTIVDGAVKITGAPTSIAGSADHPVDVACQACTGDARGLISVKFKAKGGAGASTLWWVYALDENENVLAAWNSDGTHMRGRIDGTVTDTYALNLSGFDEVEALINTAQSETVGGVPPQAALFLFNGVPMTGTNPILYDPLTFPVGTGVSLLRIQRSGNTGASMNDHLFIDDLSVSRCLEVCSDPVFDVRDLLGQEGGDGMVTAQDLTAFNDCATGPAPAASVFESLSKTCRCMDVTGDQAVDQGDFGYFQRCYTGTIGVLDPACDN